MKFCPYCHNEADVLGAGSGCDEVLDYCRECEMIIEGETVDDFDPTPDEESEPPFTWKDRAKLEKPR